MTIRLIVMELGKFICLKLRELSPVRIHYRTCAYDCDVDDRKPSQSQLRCNQTRTTFCFSSLPMRRRTVAPREPGLTIRTQNSVEKTAQMLK